MSPGAPLPRPGEAERLPRILVLAPLCVLLGLVVGRVVPGGSVTGSSWYLPAAGLLLATGLYGSTHRIEPAAMRRDLRTVTVVVTLGVLLKATLIAGVMVLLFRRPEYLVLGIAVAQIDPLSVAALSNDSRMSPRAKTLLSVWAAFDDPMTVLLSLYFSLLAYRLSGRSGTPALAPEGNGAAAYVEGIALNAALFAAAVAVWFAVRRLTRAIAVRRAAGRIRANRMKQPGRTHSGGPAGAIRRSAVAGSRPSGSAGSPRSSGSAGSSVTDVLAFLVVVALIAVAAYWMLMLAVALTGLVVRTGRFQDQVDKLVNVAFLVAAFGLGVLLTDGVSLGTGVVLGTAAFAAQAAVARLIMPRLVPDLSRNDQVFLALGQQNGITAIILALALEPDFPGTVGIVGPAILTIGVLYYASNGLWGRRMRAAADDPSDVRRRIQVKPNPVTAGARTGPEGPF